MLTLSSSSSSTVNSTPNASLPHGIYNDSSVSIVALGDGDKRLLFQEGAGNIREAIFSQSASSWTSDVSNVVATDARNNTPLAALLVNSTGTPFADDTGPVVGISFHRERKTSLAKTHTRSSSFTSPPPTISPANNSSPARGPAATTSPPPGPLT